MAKVYVRGLKEVSARFKRMSDDGVKAVQTEIEITATDISNKAAELAPVNYGELRREYRAEPLLNGIGAVVRNSLGYAAFVEFGTRSKVQIPPEFAALAQQFRGGKGGTFQELLAKIQDWCKRKGIEPEAAYPIALKIVREGTEAQPHLIPAYYSEIVKLVPNLEKRLKELTK